MRFRSQRPIRPISTKRTRSDHNGILHEDSVNTSDIEPIPSDREGILDKLHEVWRDCDDLLMHTFTVGPFEVISVWLDVLVERNQMHRTIWSAVDLPVKHPDAYTEPISFASFFHEPMNQCTDINEAIRYMVNGYVALFVVGSSTAYVMNCAKFPAKTIENSRNEPNISGPQEAFSGELTIGLGLIRKFIRSANLKVRTRRIGTDTHTRVSIVYMEGLTNPEFIQEAEKRLDGVHLKSVLDSNYVAEAISDARYSLYPTGEFSERPDKAAAAILEGRFVILVEGSPQCIILPTTLLTLLTAGEDYYSNFMVSFPVRLLRYAMFWVSITLPSLYVSLLAYNQDLIPTPLFLNIENQHEGIPFPSILEALLMMVAFEALREAGVRLPKTVGQSVSIVGALIIGDAAVNAGIVSAGMVIVVAMTGVASFTLPAYSIVNANRIMQFGFLFAAAFVGIYGVLIAFLILTTYLVSLESMGVPYLAPIAPLVPDDLTDSVIRFPWWARRTKDKIFQLKQRG